MKKMLFTLGALLFAFTMLTPVSAEAKTHHHKHHHKTHKHHSHQHA